MTPAAPPHRVAVVRVYDDHDTGDGGPCRVLVDRLWPRGVAKAAAGLDEWNVDVAPSTDLRRWYGHDPSRFIEFARRYRIELTHPPASQAVTHLVEVARDRNVALVTATRDVEHSGARVLCDHLARLLEEGA
jgi:uncharacterized protein YeaO (DUF488 family)